MLITELADLMRQPDGSCPGFLIQTCLRDAPTPGAWFTEALRVVAPGGRVRLSLEPDKRGENVSPAWLLHWVEGVAEWTIQRREGGGLMVWMQRPAMP